MKRTLFLIVSFILFMKIGLGQVEIFKESFGDGFPGAILQSNYDKYDHPGLFNIDTVEINIRKGNKSSSGYDEASGNSYVQMDGHWEWDGTTPLSDTLLITSVDTRNYTDIHLSFGIYNRTGWSGISNHAFEGWYSTDNGQSWTQIDKTNTINGNHFPGNNNWGWVTLGESLPAVENLQILIENPEINAHTCFIDDIMLTGFPPDDTPPSTPMGLTAFNTDISSVDLVWNASSDNTKVSYYILYKDGKQFLTTADTSIQVQYQTPGSSVDFTVAACDIAANISSQSTPLTVDFESKPVDFEYSWQKAHAKVLPEGDLEWQPKDFVFESGSSVRYIDYENGDDSNDGQTTSTPWKHHPWDDNATDNAAACSGVHTYVFKRGVIYRGKMIAAESGNINEPVRLTSDPSWGSGEAYIFGSSRFTDGWTQADAASAPNIPNPENVWYRDVSLPDTKYICELDGENYKPIRVARSPNYKYTPDDPVKSWWEWTDKEIIDDGSNIWLTDNTNLTQDNPDFYEGASVYSQEDAWVMCTVRFLDVKEWDPDNNRVKIGHSKFGGKGCKYFIENTPFLLDTTSEFYYDKDAERLFVRLDNDKDPNTTVIEIAEKDQLIEIDNKHHIEISGLTFGLTTSKKIRHWEADAKSAIRMTGVCTNINIKNNKFVYQNGAVSLHNMGSANDNSKNITVSDNEFEDIGDLSLIISTGGLYLDNVNILRNKLSNVGFRQLGRQWSSIPAIWGQFNYGEVAGNIIDFSWGNGIDIFWGKGKHSGYYVPFVRGLIHHNKASNTVLGTNDYGGIESWQGGPTYCYNNRSHNAPGYRHYDNTSIGYAFYFDGCFKHYVFNNIASGVSNQRNAASYQQVLGYYNMFVHNTGHNTRTMFDGAPGGLNGHNTYLSNIAEDIEVYFWHKIDPEYIPFDSYGYNLASGKEFKATLEDKSSYLNLTEFKDKLESYESQLTHTAWNAGKQVITDAENFDFRPLANGEAIDRGVKFFASFPLAKVVGEWNFYKHPADLSIIMADNLYLTEDFDNRDIYQDIPKNHLNAHNVTDGNFIIGDLEDWTEGALEFDGSSVYCSLNHDDVKNVMSNNVDMTTNDFIIEAYLKTSTDHTNGVIVSKYNGSAGYVLDIDESGMPQMTLYESGSAAVSNTASVAINDGSWHHVLVEVNRYSIINIYVDGDLANGSITGSMPNANTSLSNTADFLVGKDMNDNYFSGTLDFLRVSKANLYEAKTTVDELYTWQTEGPFLYDMTGKEPMGKRDAGALEIGEKECTMTISPASLNFDENADTKTLTVTASEGFELLSTSAELYSAEIAANNIEVSVDDNEMAIEKEDAIPVFGCNETKYIPVIQAAAPCEFSLESENLTIDKESQTVKIAVNTNGNIDLSCQSSFANERLNQTSDTILVDVFENTSDNERSLEIEIASCDGTHILTITQEGENTSIDQLKPEGLHIYPNPVTNSLLNIKVPENVNQYTYSLLELTGKVVQSEKIHASESSIRLDLATGVYILKIESKQFIYKTQITIN